jgi:DNA-binding MarR family transcriptional regulator
VNILLFLCTFWWTKDGRPRLAIGTIAEAVDRSPRHVTRIISGLVDVGLIERHQRSKKETRNLTIEYSFEGLIKEVMPFTKKKIEDRGYQVQDGQPKAAGCKGQRLIRYDAI